jgi:hypothetical protein
MRWGCFLNRIRLLAEVGQARSAKVTEDGYAEAGT